MSRTKQQQAVVDAALDPDIHLIKVKATAGSGKTFTLVELAKELQPETGLYLAYNKAIAEEATQKFAGTNIKCSTIHSLAYSSVVRQYGLKVGFFGIRNVQPSSTPYRQKMEVVNTLEDFFLSGYTDVQEYFTDAGTSDYIEDMCLDHLNLMTTGAIQCSHSFYLKLFHIYMAMGEIETPEVDLLLVDEAGDITALTLDIFRLIKAEKKIAVGDPMQNIYSFNKTINAFDELHGEGVDIELTESFRVSDVIASRIEGFVHNNLDNTFKFQGRHYPINTPITTKAYIARNNSGLLEEMFRLQEEAVPFHTTRKIDIILELPLVLANLGSGSPITEYKYKHIEKMRSDWEKSKMLQTKYKSVGSYVRFLSPEDEELIRAFQVVMAHGPREINNLVKYAKECAKTPCNLTLTTAHSSKGLEFSSVEIAPDLNEKIADTIYKIKKENLAWNEDTSETIIASLQEEFRLYYVSCSRSMVELKNAIFLPQGIIK